MNRDRNILIPLAGWMGGLLVLASAGLWLIVSHSRQKLEAYKIRLEHRGETFVIAELAPPPAPGENGDRLVAAVSGLGNAITAGPFKPFSPGRRETRPGHAETVHKRHAALSTKNDVSWEVFRSHLETLRPGLEATRLAAKAPALEIQLDYAQGFAMQMPFVNSILRSCQFLAAESILFLHENKLAEAVDNIETVLVLAGVNGRQPNWISQLVAASIVQMASAATWEILHADPVSAPELERLQKAWQAVHPGAFLTRSIRMERAWGVQAFSSPAGIGSSLSGGSPSSSLDKLLTTATNATWKTFFRYGDEYWFVERTQRLLDSLDDGDWEKAFAHSQEIQASVETRGLSRKLGHLILQPIGGMLEKMAATEAMRELCLTAIAIRRYQLAHSDELPDSLQALVPVHLDSVRKDPMDNQPLRYRRDGQFYLLYALGENGVDDGGNPAPIPGKRRRDLLQSLDIVWPRAIPSVTPAPGGGGPGTRRE